MTSLIKDKKTFGKSIDEWHRVLTVKVDPSADPAKVNLYCSELALNIDTAYRNLSTTKYLYSLYKMSYDNAINDKVAAQALNKSRKVIPSADTLVRVAESQLGDRVIVAAQYEAAIEFWQNMVYKLKDLIDLVKTVGMSNGTRFKIGEY